VSVFDRAVLPEVEFGAVPFWRQWLRGFSQCAFQANEVTAVFLILAVAVFSLQQAAFYLIAVLVGTAVAKVAKGVPDLLDLGLYGFNSGLFGLSMAAFFAPSPLLWVTVVVGAAVVALVTVAFSKLAPFPFLAAPFILTFWAFYPVAESVGLEKLVFDPFTDEKVFFINATFSAMGGALFAGTVISGLLFIIGVGLSNWRHAVVAFVCTLVAHIIATEWQTSAGAINAGLIGFNAVLCSIAVYSMCGQDLRLTLFGAIGATILIRLFNNLGLVPLAAGFVTMTWFIMLLGWLGPKFNGTPKEPKPA
jgi:urea transporter